MSGSIHLPSSIAPLASYPRWVGWRWVVKKNGERDKPPFRVDHPEFNASTDNPRSWASYGQAEAALVAGKLDGIGYVCRDDAERIFIDLDNCRDPVTGEIADWAMRLVEEANSYTEVTPSGRGLRIIGTHGHISAPIHKAYKLAGGGSGEVFFRATRYVTVTGNRLPGTPDTLADIADVTLDLLVSAGKMEAGSTGEAREHAPNPRAEAPIEDVRAALAVIPNPDMHYDDWVRVGLAAFGATRGSQDGFAAWEEWSAKSAKHDSAECVRVWQSIHKAPPTKIGFGSLYHMALNARPLFVPPSWVHEVPRDKAGADAGPGAEGQGQQSARALLPLIFFGDAKPNLDAADFVEGLLTERAMSVVYGPSNCGKTFFMTDLSLHVATGRTWRGREIEPGGVIYCALEGAHGISNRVAAFARENELEGVEVPFAIVPVALNLREPDAGDIARLCATVKAAADAMGVPVKLVVIDTLSRALAGGDENRPDDMGAVVNAADLIRQEVGAHVCFIHHSGKDESRGARGHSLLRAATDTEIEISRPDKDSPSVARVTKQREMEIDGEFVFRLRSVELGTNRRGKPVTSCVVEHNDGPAPEVKRPLPDNAKAALVALREALAKGARTLPPSPDMPAGVRAVWLSEWRREFYARSTADSQEAKQKAFVRSSRELIKRGLTAVLNDQAWLITEQ